MDQKFDFPCRFEKLDIVDEQKYRSLVETTTSTILFTLLVFYLLLERKTQTSLSMSTYLERLMVLGSQET